MNKVVQQVLIGTASTILAMLIMGYLFNRPPREAPADEPETTTE